jgi:glycosyltransferase involved in cell wall biosynthesis
MALNLLYVVHRYGYPGGSEQYTRDMAEESLRRGNNVAVFAGDHTGNLNGVYVTSDTNIFARPWDLIIVHGGDVSVQNFVLSNAKVIPSPILYLIVLPSTSDVCLQALQDCRYIGCSTNQDWEHCARYGVSAKSVQVRHGITWHSSMGAPGFKQKYGISGKMFLSCGGYWPNKAMKELVRVFDIANLRDTVLVTTGYDNKHVLMPEPSANVIPLLLDDRNEVLSAIYEADCLIMHSFSEGFGLVLLESMINQTPWIARKIAGAELMQNFGQTYKTDGELIFLMRTFDRKDFDIKAAFDYVANNHLIAHTVDDIEKVAQQTRG